MCRSIGVAGIVASFCLAGATVLMALPQSTQQPTPTVKVGSSVAAKAASPAPGSTAQNQSQKTSVGAGKLAVQASQPSSFWTEQVDLEGNGSLVSSDFLYDANRGVVYSYREDDFTCQDGQPGRANMLEAMYGTGNKAGQPVGSGWYVVGLNAGQCAAQAAGEYGCQFNASGNPTTCGIATINYATGDVDIAAAAQ